jgi:hypothetical protein
VITHFVQGEAKKKKKKKKSKKKKVEQSDPPRVGLSKLFPSGIYPEGELQPYKDEYVVSSFGFFFWLNLSLLSAMPTASRQKKPNTKKNWRWATPNRHITIFAEAPKFIVKPDALPESSFVQV